MFFIIVCDVVFIILLCNRTGYKVSIFKNETIISLKNCGAAKETEILENETYLNNDFEEFWKRVNGYIEREKQL